MQSGSPAGLWPRLARGAGLRRDRVAGDVPPPLVRLVVDRGDLLENRVQLLGRLRLDDPRDGDGLSGTYWPAALYVPAMSVGCTRTPLLAIVAYTLAICTALTETPWPYDRVYCSSARPVRRRRQPFTAPCCSRLVRQPEARRLADSELLQVLIPNLRRDVRATWDMPMLEEFAMMPAIV